MSQFNNNNNEQNIEMQQQHETFSPHSKVGLVGVLAGKNVALFTSLLIVAISFFIIAGTSYEVHNLLKNNLDLEKYQWMSWLGFVFVIIPVFGQMFIRRRLNRTNPMILGALIILYIIGQIFGFSIIFLNYGVDQQWFWVFAIAGGVFLVCALVGYFVPWINKLWKYVAAVSAIWFIAMIVLMILRFSVSSVVIQDAYLIMTGVFGLLTMFYIMYDIHKLKNFIYHAGSERLAINTILFISLRLLIDLMNLVWIIARFAIFNKR